MKRNLIRKLSFSFLVTVCAVSLTAQTPYELIRQDIERAAGHYHHYEVPEANSRQHTHPNGYKAFYISHYGRHGCRWHTSSLVYRRPLAPMLQFKTDGVLTPFGEELLSKLSFIADDAEGRGGDLTPRGVREQRGIAERMFANYPEVFSGQDGKPARIRSRSTDVPRCILSMCAFNERLKELEPELEMERTACKRDLDYMINREGAKKISRKARTICDSLQKEWLDPERFLCSIISDRNYIRDKVKSPERLMFHIFQIAAILQDTDYLGLSLFNCFTDDELAALWKCENAYVYLTQGPSEEFGRLTVPDAIPLLCRIIRSADEAIAGENDIAVSLRFGHDQALVPLCALMGIQGASDRVPAEDAHKFWNVSTVTPMSANLQFIFFRSMTIGGNDGIKVRILHNERDAVLPLDSFPFYAWDELRDYLAVQCR